MSSSFALSAVADLDAVRAWYDEQHVPEMGDRPLREIVAHVERLAELPESGCVVPEFGLVQLREIIHPPFRIVYRFSEGRVRVVCVWRSERRLQLPS